MKIRKLWLQEDVSHWAIRLNNATLSNTFDGYYFLLTKKENNYLDID
jgi:hypothetical protein